MRGGFTILELSAVLAIMALLTASAVPGYTLLVDRARTDEARTMLETVAHAEQRAFRDTGHYVACPPVGPVPTGAVPFPAATCWQALNLRVDGPVRFRYGVVLDAATFVATAEGDLNADGVPSLFSLSGADMTLTIRDELE